MPIVWYRAEEVTQVAEQNKMGLCGKGCYFGTMDHLFEFYDNSDFFHCADRLYGRGGDRSGTARIL